MPLPQRTANIPENFVVYHQSGMRTMRKSWYRSRRALLWAGGAVAVACGLVALFAFGPNKNAAPEVFNDDPVQVPVVQKKAPLSEAAKKVAIRFVQTAVARENLEEAWELVGPNLRGGLTRAEWISGDNPVVPYPIDQLEVAPYKIDESFVDSALLEVALLPKEGAGVRSQIFFLGLKKVGKGENARWLVDNWVPRGSALTPR
jgi:hypothetical protein